MHFLRKPFAPKEQLWKPFCDDIGGRYVKSGLFRGDRIEIAHHGHVISLVAESEPDTGHRSTLLRAEVNLVDGLMLGLYRDRPGHKMIDLTVSLFGLQRTAVFGLSDDCTLLAKDQRHAEAFFGDTGLQELILQQPQLVAFVGMPSRLSQRGGAKQVWVAVPLLVQDLSQLQSLVALLRKLIDVLSDKGLIAPQADVS